MLETKCVGDKFGMLLGTCHMPGHQYAGNCHQHNFCHLHLKMVINIKSATSWTVLLKTDHYIVVSLNFYLAVY